MITREDVKHVALLARLGMTEQDIDKFSQQLSVILENFEVLNQADVSTVSPTAQVLPAQNITRNDEVIPSYPPEVILANAPSREQDFIRVRPVFEE